MSLTPLDETGDGSRQGEGSERSDRRSSGISWLASRGSEVLGRALDACRSLFTSSEGAEPDERESRDRDRSPSANTGSGRPTVVDARDSATVSARSGDSDLLDLSTSRERPRDDVPDLVSNRRDGRLTLREPDSPGARISSDRWEEVER
ncbi:MAG: hypothetical protein ABEJ40_09355 [Haloarculaceae archaeon]